MDIVEIEDDFDLQNVDINMDTGIPVDKEEETNENT